MGADTPQFSYEPTSSEPAWLGPGGARGKGGAQPPSPDSTSGCAPSSDQTSPKKGPRADESWKGHWGKGLPQRPVMVGRPVRGPESRLLCVGFLHIGQRFLSIRVGRISAPFDGPRRLGLSLPG